MKRFDIGPGVTCDLDRLVDTRLLVQANSGGGKSWLLRRLLEQTHGQVQHLVIDPEGEFASLREKFDYVLAAKHGGDTAADPRSATLLAERLLELKVSAILDIYELKPHERIAFVRRFLEALIDAPKALWHPALVVVDECHVYCPQVGEAESAGAVKDLATRGRKRGFCAVLATQRLSKLHKDAAAECNNKLIGRTSLDVDMARAGDELGFTKEARHEFRKLDAGQFYAFGPAFDGAKSIGVTPVQVGDVKTTHPKAGARLAFTAPPPTSKITALLPQLADLPAEAEERVKSVEVLKREVADLRRDLTRAKHAQPAAETKTVEKFVLKDGQLARAEKLVERLDGIRDVFRQDMAEFASQIGERVQEAETINNTIANDVRKIANEIATAIGQTRAPQQSLAPVRFVLAIPPTPAHASNGDLTGPERKIIRALMELRVLGLYPADKQQLGLLAGYTNIRSGGFAEPFGRLHTDGYLVSERGTVEITGRGVDAAGPVDPPADAEDLQRRILEKLTGPEQRLLKVLLAQYPMKITKEQLAAACDPPYTNIRSGGFAEPIGRLNTLGLIKSQRGTVVASAALFLEGK